VAITDPSVTSCTVARSWLRVLRRTDILLAASRSPSRRRRQASAATGVVCRVWLS
jgi:hypothetical protein